MSCTTAELLIRSDSMRPDEERSAAATQETLIHWGEASAFVRRRLQYELPTSSFLGIEAFFGNASGALATRGVVDVRVGDITTFTFSPY